MKQDKGMISVCGADCSSCYCLNRKYALAAMSVRERFSTARKGKNVEFERDINNRIANLCHKYL